MTSSKLRLPAHPSRKTSALFAVLTLSGSIGVARAQEVRLYVTSQAGDRITLKRSLHFSKAGSTGPVFKIDDTTQYQKIVGFGASFLEAGMICINSLDRAAQEHVFQSLFDPEKGAGFSAMKTVIGATDFMSAGPYYTYDDHPGDLGMKLFSIERDLTPNGLVTYIKRARRYGSFVLQAPMDYPPDWMLFNVENHQDVDPHFFHALALYYLHYLREYAKQGIFVDYVSLFNEPGIYTKISASKIRDLLKDYAGPLFAKEGVKNGIQACESNNREHAYEQWAVILDDPGARRYVGAIAYHGYDFKDYDKIADLHRRYPDLKLWMTEVDHSYNTDTRPPAVLPRRDYEDGDFWGNQIFNDLEAGTSAWIYWNMVLDEKGGPWLVSPVHRDPKFNAQHPVVVIDRQKRDVFYTGLYYYLAHFSKFVRPGAVRVATSGSDEGLRCTAFLSKNNAMIAQVLNSRTQTASVNVEWHGSTLNLSLPALSITTCLWQ
jgi:glucosylceramidase